jgi:cytochrome c oxidase subunit IV
MAGNHDKATALGGNPVLMEPSATLRVLYRVAAGLLALLALTVGLAFIDMGPFNLLMALLIAAAKAALVVLFFMEVRYSSRLTWIMAGAGLLWLLLLIGGTLADYMTRVTLVLPSPLPQTWTATTEEKADPRDPRNSGNLGPAGGWSPADIAPSGPSGTPGEPVPSSDQ